MLPSTRLPAEQTLPASSGASLASLLGPRGCPPPPPGPYGLALPRPSGLWTGGLWIPSGPPRAPIEWNEDLGGIESN